MTCLAWAQFAANKCAPIAQIDAESFGLNRLLSRPWRHLLCTTSTGPHLLGYLQVAQSPEKVHDSICGCDCVTISAL
jgi:hypothetical protein